MRRWQGCPYGRTEKILDPFGRREKFPLTREVTLGVGSRQAHLGWGVILNWCYIGREVWLLEPVSGNPRCLMMSDELSGMNGFGGEGWGKRKDKVNFSVLSVSCQFLPRQASVLWGLLSPCHSRSAGQSFPPPGKDPPSHTHQKNTACVHYISTGWGLENKTAPHCFEWEWFNSIQEWVKGENPQFRPNNFCLLFTRSLKCEWDREPELLNLLL